MPERGVAPPIAGRRGAVPATLLVGVALAAGGAAPPVPRPPADLILRNARVYTVDAARSWASAVAVREGRIAFAGDDAGALAWRGESTRVVDLGGRMLLPGFADSHVHPASGGLELLLCDLNGSADAAEVERRIAAWATEHADAPWVRGGGWDLPLYPAAGPPAGLLDRLVPDRPAALSSADGHTLWVNQRAMRRANLTRRTPDPPDGRIERDPLSGEPTGVLREGAMDLVRDRLPEPTLAERVEGLRRAVEMAHRFGITAVFEASAGREELETYRALDRQGGLRLRVRAALGVDARAVAGGAIAPEVSRLADLRSAGGEGWGPNIVPGAAKLFADGVIEARTAALLEPYVGEAAVAGRGLPNWEPSRLAEMAVALDGAGFQLHFHAIGDAGIRVALDAIAAAQDAHGRRDRRPVLAHVQLFDPADLPRLRDLGAAASFQPLWMYADPYIVDLTEPVLGSRRSRWLYPIASYHRTGGVLAAGSDWSVSSMNPLEGIEVALTRRGPRESDGESWLPEERVDLGTMLAAYTAGSQWAMFGDREAGTIEAGKAADLVVLDRDLFAIAPQAISEVRVLWTLFGGEEAYRAPDFAPGDATANPGAER